MATQTKKFKLFDSNRDGKGVYEEENRKPTLWFFFKLLWRKLSQLVRLNVLLFVQVIPVLVFLYVYFLGVKTPTATEALYAPLYGISKISSSPSLTAMLDMNAIQMGIPIFSPVIMIVLIVLAVIFALTYGWINVGSAYVARGLFRGDPVFVFSDFFYAIKKNFKQAFWFGLLDFVCTVVLIVDFLHFYSRTGSYGNDVMYFMIIAVALVYIIMRFYIYHMMLTFDLTVKKILKNALIFTALGIKRNLLALLGIALFLAVHILLIKVFLSMGITIPIILPFFYAMAIIKFITTYAAFPVIEKYMITPYQKEAEATEEADAIEEA
jgi:uncharacterized membrane protein YesL